MGIVALAEETCPAELSYQVAEIGLTLTAEFDGHKRVVGWEASTASAKPHSAPELFKEFVDGCRREQMNLVSIHLIMRRNIISESLAWPWLRVSDRASGRLY